MTFRPRAPQPSNRVNKSKRKFSVHPSVAKFAKLSFQMAFVTIAIVGVVYVGWQYVYKVVRESYKPNAEAFSQCANSFIQIKPAPTYGVVLKTDGSQVTDIFLTAPSGVSSVKAIHLAQRDWVTVFFSNNFAYTQVGEFLRLSKLETGEYNYCYILEQLGLTSGVPLEYAIVEDAQKGLSSTVSIAAAQAILQSVEQQGTLEFKRDLLPLHLLDDNSKVSVITYNAFVEQFATFFRIDSIAQEQAFVEVYNSTDISGYASIMSRKWSMLGIDVSRVGNAAHEQLSDANAVIYVNDEAKYARTLGIIKSSFPEGSVTVRSGRPANVMATGDIVVFLLKR